MKIQFVLVEPGLPENIGASARAVRTMGYDTLLLVNPCEWREGKARWVAHGSADILDSAAEFGSLAEALRDSDLNIATSARHRNVKQDIVNAVDLAGFIKSKERSVSTVSLVFGREESGLTNEEIKQCDISSAIPLNCSFPSLNLSQAVMIYAYELSGLRNTENNSTSEYDPISFRHMRSRTIEIMSRLGISETDNRYGRILERISFLRSDDINLVHSVSNLLLEKLQGSGSR